MKEVFLCIKTSVSYDGYDRKRVARILLDGNETIENARAAAIEAYGEAWKVSKQCDKNGHDIKEKKRYDADWPTEHQKELWRQQDKQRAERDAVIQAHAKQARAESRRQRDEERRQQQIALKWSNSYDFEYAHHLQWPENLSENLPHEALEAIDNEYKHLAEVSPDPALQICAEMGY